MLKKPEDDDELTIPNEEEDDEEGQPGRIDDEGGDEAEAGQEPEDAEAEERQVEGKGRATKAVQEAKRIAREASAEAAALRKEMDALLAERQQAAQPTGPREETEQEFNQRIALMTADERSDAKLDRSERRHQRELNAMAFRTQDELDKAAFRAVLADSPKLRKFEAEVEEELAKARRNGGNASREVVLDYVLGRKVRLANSKPQRQAAQQRIQRQTTRPESGRSDQPAQRERAAAGNSLAALERRLTGVSI